MGQSHYFLIITFAQLSSCWINHKQNIIFPSTCDPGIDCGKYNRKYTMVLPFLTCPDTLSEAEYFSLINVQAICELQVS